MTEFSIYDAISIAIAVGSLVQVSRIQFQTSRPLVQLRLTVEPWYNPDSADAGRRRHEDKFHGLEFRVTCRNNGSQTIEVRSLTIESWAGPKLTRIRKKVHGRVWHVPAGEEHAHSWHDFLTQEPLETWYERDNPHQVRAVVKFASRHKHRTEWENLPRLPPHR